VKDSGPRVIPVQRSVPPLVLPRRICFCSSFLGLSSSSAIIPHPPLPNALSPVHTPARCFRNCCFLHPCPPPFGSYRIPSLMFLRDNGRLEFAPFFPSASLFCGAVISYSPSLPPIDSHFDYRFIFDLHTCGSLHLGLANSLLVLSLSRS